MFLFVSGLHSDKISFAKILSTVLVAHAQQRTPDDTGSKDEHYHQEINRN